MWAFGLEECEQYDKAEKEALKVEPVMLTMVISAP
ncbi:unnamed protein product [Cylicostephanus goldi]|uniref:Uncharacterized protein n=1 Tax=Cylicostephanus goldi TaxID=71465 RepID=A0A3P7QNB9_CYLGO|nr:unnamed protein product [Cylicostephanus goldi]